MPTLKKLFTAGDAGRRGAALIQFAVMLVAIIGFVALGVEVVMALSTSRRMQAAADASALAAAAALYHEDAAWRQAGFGQAATLGFVDGQNDTHVAVNSPPATGSYPDGAVEAMISQPQILWLARVVFPGIFTIGARAVAAVPEGDYGSCILALDPTASDALRMTGSSTVTLDGCDVSVNSTSASAVRLVGGATIKARTAYVEGGVSTAGGGALDAAGPWHIATPDPYASYTIPTYGGCNHTNFNPVASATISQGVYCGGITVNAGVTLTLNPGVYILDGGRGTGPYRGRGLVMTGGSGLTSNGNGVTIVLTSSTGSSYPTVSIGGGATVDLTAPSDEANPLHGMVFFQDRNAPSGGSNGLNGGDGQKINGAVYFPNQTLLYTGSNTNVAQCTQLIADKITIVGGMTLNAACTGSGVSPIGGGHPVLVD